MKITDEDKIINSFNMIPIKPSRMSVTLLSNYVLVISLMKNIATKVTETHASF